MLRTKLLFISRAYPPVVGGIERQNYELATHLANLADVTLIVNRHGKRFLPLFLPWAIFRSLWLSRAHDVVLLGDGVLGLVAWILKKFTNTPVACILHGLDITYPAPIYQYLWVRHWIPSADRFFPVSRETRRQAIKKGISADRCLSIPNGVDPNSFESDVQRRELERLLNRPLAGRRLLLTVGRLIRRKGVAWFVDQVLPRLGREVLYLIVGDGPERNTIAAIIDHHELREQALLLGRVEENVVRKLLGGVDLFIQPNILVEGDMEGFGLVVLEASASGTPVIASRLEGLMDAITEGKNGVLVTPGSVEEFLTVIQDLLEDELARRRMGESAKALMKSEYSWSTIADHYYRACLEL
ncbi:TetR family transcriptional regulator [Gammaproteobacteria bacterium]